MIDLPVDGNSSSFLNFQLHRFDNTVYIPLNHDFLVLDFNPTGRRDLRIPRLWHLLPRDPVRNPVPEPDMSTSSSGGGGAAVRKIK